VVAVNVAYHVGSKNEKPGRTGFAHLFEHVMFQGSEHIPYGVHFKTIENAGGDANGGTEEDETTYFETMPSNQLATALWLESDRMGFLLPALDQAKLDAQRDVVKNERRQRVDNQPYGSANEVVLAAMYPSSNPYSWPVIGSMADLSAATLSDVKDFFRMYYAPNNAALAVSGDFNVKEAKALIAKYFGAIPAGPAITRPTVPPVTLTTEKRLVLEDEKSQQPQFQITWPTVGTDQPDAVPLSVLRSVLAQDRTSRLTKLLVYDRQLATNLSAWQNSHENTGDFPINVTPRPGASLTEIERLVDSTITALLTTSPATPAEVDRVKNYTRVNSVFRLEGAMQRADVLLNGQTFYGDPLYYVTRTNALLATTAADVNRVAHQYLTPGRIVLSMVPAGKLDLIANPHAAYTNVTPQSAPAPAATPSHAAGK
jgi:zinc protease